MSNLWTPTRVQTLPRATLPAGNVRLADGRLLKAVQHAAFDAGGGVIQDQTVYAGPRGLRVIGSVDPTHHGLLLHISLSYGDHIPSWEDIRAVRDAFYPDTVDCMMVLPRTEDYVNLHPYTMHLWQTPEGWEIQ